jgi:hypothetical protein
MSRCASSSLIAASLALALACGAAQAGAPAAARAIWTWEPASYAMLERPAEADEAIAFLQAKSVRTLFLYADAFHARSIIANEPQRYRQLIAKLHGAGMRVYALLGSGYLKTERYVLPGHRAEALAMFQRVLDYNAKAAPAERFDGINLDIEPHILDEWDTQKMALLHTFIDLSADFMALKAKSGQALQVGPAIPFWWDNIPIAWRGRTRAMSEHVQDIYDYVALMDYRDHAGGPDGIVSHGEDELRYAARAGKQVLIGIETTPNDIDKVSFNHLKEADMERELALSEQAFAASPAFGGFVLHHYAGYRKWLRQ